MYRDNRFVTYVTPLIGTWIRDQALERRISSSIVICDCIYDAWERATGSDLKTPATDPVRQNIFITVALDALLTHHPHADLREKTVAAYQRRIERLGIVAPQPLGGRDEA